MPRLLTASVAVVLACLLLALPARAQPAAPVEGTDYVLIADGTPWQPLDGKIEVVEVFGYWCHVCNALQPMVDAWLPSLPRDVRFTYVPAAFSLPDAYARAHFASVQLGGLARTHAATFRAIHAQQALPMRGASLDEVAAFYGTLGLDAARVRAAMQSPATDARMTAARDFAIRSGVEGVPTFIVNGRYRVQARSLGDMLRVVDALVAQERAKAPAAR